MLKKKRCKKLNGRGNLYLKLLQTEFRNFQILEDNECIYYVLHNIRESLEKRFLQWNVWITILRRMRCSLSLAQVVGSWKVFCILCYIFQLPWWPHDTEQENCVPQKRWNLTHCRNENMHAGTHICGRVWNKQLKMGEAKA